MEGVNDTPSVRPIELTTNLFFFFLNEIFCYGSNSVLESELICYIYRNLKKEYYLYKCLIEGCHYDKPLG